MYLCKVLLTVMYIPLQHCNIDGSRRNTLAVSSVSFVLLCSFSSSYYGQNVCCTFTSEKMIIILIIAICCNPASYFEFVDLFPFLLVDGQ